MDEHIKELCNDFLEETKKRLLEDYGNKALRKIPKKAHGFNRGMNWEKFLLIH
jgi:hypothetical protein